LFLGVHYENSPPLYSIDEPSLISQLYASIEQESSISNNNSGGFEIKMRFCMRRRREMK